MKPILVPPHILLISLLTLKLQPNILKPNQKIYSS